MPSIVDYVPEAESSAPRPITAGDVIRCVSFEWGLRFDGQDDVSVTWRGRELHAGYHIQQGAAQDARDPSRGQALHLVTSVKLIRAEGPDDVYPNERRLSRAVVCRRLHQDDTLDARCERIRFNLDEPMSVFRPDESEIVIVGRAKLPLWL